MISIYLLIILLVILLIQFPKYMILLASIIIIYPLLKNKFTSSSDFITYVKNLLGVWWNNGDLKEFKIDKLEIPNSIPPDATFQEVQNIIDSKWDKIAQEERLIYVNKMLGQFPIIKKYQDWLYSQQDLYIEYQIDVKNIWEEMLDKLVLITQDTVNFCSQNFQDFLEYQQKLLDIMEFIQSQSDIMNENYGINNLVKVMIIKNRELNQKIGYWLKNNLEKLPINTRLGYNLENFNVEDWVAPYNFFENTTLLKN